MAQGNPVMRGTLVAVFGLALAGLLGWGLMSIGANRLKLADQEKEPLRQAMSYLAGDAITNLDETELAIAGKNWGDAQRPLQRADEIVSAMEKSTTPDTQDTVQQARSALREAEDAVAHQDQASPAKLDAVAAKLRTLQVK